MLIKQLILTISLIWRLIAAVNVAVFLPGTDDLERKSLNRLAQELAFRNHRVCAFRLVIVPEQRYLVQQRLVDVRELKLAAGLNESMYGPVRDRGESDVYWTLDYELIDHKIQVPVWTAYVQSCATALNSDVMDRLRDELYAVAVVQAGNPCYLALVHAMAMPFIYFDPTGFSDEVMIASGSPILPALLPSAHSIFTNKMSFSERLINLGRFALEYTCFSGIDLIADRFCPRRSIMEEPISKLFREDDQIKKRFPKGFPSVWEIKRLAAAYFINSDRVIEFHRHLPQNLIFVGGMHIEYPRPMFPPYNETNALAKNGVILFSMGTVVNCKLMPLEKKLAFVNAFRRFPDNRIYWRLGSSSIDGVDSSELPKNLNISYYIPQNDLLAAEETVLLISNGGANSIMEALHYGVPVLGVPLYGANYNNLRKLEAKGMAIVLDKNQLTEDTIYESIKELLTNRRYTLTARRLGRRFRDRPLTPLETAIHWTEYIGRHHGLPRSSSSTGKFMDFFRFFMLDLIGIVLLCLIVVILMLRKCVRKLCKLSPSKDGHSTSESRCSDRSKTNGYAKLTNGHSVVKKTDGSKSVEKKQQQQQRTDGETRTTKKAKKVD